MTSLSERRQIIEWVDTAIRQGARQSKAAAIIGLPARTLQRWKQSSEIKQDGRKTREFMPPNKLTEEERGHVLSMANSDEFKHMAPHQIVPVLAERGAYIASESSFYRILKAEKQLAHRHSSRVPTSQAKPQALTATAPNQLYSWDITYLATCVKGLFYYLYLFVDIFSRKIVGWQVYNEESSAHAADVIKDICRQENIAEDQVTLHSDNGGPMKGATMLATLQKLGVIPSLSRPSVSNDNPYSESLFRTLKYRPNYPFKPFDKLEDARQWVAGFVAWYNHEHRHSGIQFVTPAQRHAGNDQAILTRRKATYLAAKEAHPNRWSQAIRNWDWCSQVCLNPDKADHKSIHSGGA
jgi:transposase InsO family protein